MAERGFTDILSAPHQHQHHTQHQQITLSTASVMGSTTITQLTESEVRNDLPDILNSHLPPPPYSTLPPSPPTQMSLPPMTPHRGPPPAPPPPPPLPTGRPPLPSRRILHAPTALVAHCSRPNYLRPNCAVSESETSASKTCLMCNGVSLRWFILLIAFIGLLCTIVGTILGALRATGKEHITLALLMIGIGIVLMTLSAVAWKLTSSGPSWRSILGLHEIHQQSQSLCNGSSINDASRRFVPRVPAPYGRTGTHHHPYGAMFYPEFHYRPPPPSYQASMQEYRLRLLLLDRTTSHPQSTSLSPVSPPPTYRSSAASSLTGTLTRPSQCNTIQRATTHPPSYRLNTGAEQLVVSTMPSQLNSNRTLSSFLSTQHQPKSVSITSNGVSPTTVTTVTTSQPHSQPHSSSSQLNSSFAHQTHFTLCSQSRPHSPHTTSSSHHNDINRVTILQTTNTSQVCTPNGVNIVAITPSSTVTANTPTPHKFQILAHV